MGFGPDQKQGNGVGANIILNSKSTAFAYTSGSVGQSYLKCFQTMNPLQPDARPFSRFQRGNKRADIIIDFTVRFSKLLQLRFELGVRNTRIFFRFYFQVNLSQRFTSGKQFAALQLL